MPVQNLTIKAYDLEQIQVALGLMWTTRFCVEATLLRIKAGKLGLNSDDVEEIQRRKSAVRWSD